MEIRDRQYCEVHKALVSLAAFVPGACATMWICGKLDWDTALSFLLSMAVGTLTVPIFGIFVVKKVFDKWALKGLGAHDLTLRVAACVGLCFAVSLPPMMKAEYAFRGPSDSSLVARFEQWRATHTGVEQFEVWRHDDILGQRQSKGYVRLTKPPEDVVSQGETETRYHHISGRWYAYHERDFE